jgi:formylglycine-generating enzyme required for sulfatase activity
MSLSDVCQGSACGAHPQVCVDWCDAYSYCKGVGKRLCGSIFGGPVVEQADTSSTWVDQWYIACVSGKAKNPFVYGAAYDPDRCNGYEHWHDGQATTVAVGSMPGCQSGVPGYAGVYDLSGNVWEWEDACWNESCAIRGGSFFLKVEPALGLNCHHIASADRDGPFSYVGFRCCSAP